MGLPPTGNNSQAPKGWYSRGYLPHFDKPALIQAITIRLVDSMPREVLERWERELASLPPNQLDRARRRRIEDYLDARQGECWLQRQR